MPDRHHRDGPASVWAVAGIVAAMVCCVGIPLLAALGTGAVGSALAALLGKPVVLMPAAALFAVAAVLAVTGRHR